MKWLLAILLLSSGQTILSQDTCGVIEAETDRSTGKTSWGAKEKIVVSADRNRQAVSIYIFKHTENPSIIMVMTGVSSKFKCVDAGDKVEFLFRDGSKLELTNQGKSNCDGRFSLYFGDAFGKVNELNQLISKPVQLMKIFGKGEFIEEQFSDKNSGDLVQVLSCLKMKW